MDNGVQKQLNQPTVLGLIEIALLQLIKQSILCISCGCMDAGVHANVSYCHCDFSFNSANVIESLN